MIEETATEVRIVPEGGKWEACHDPSLFGGPREVRLEGVPVLRRGGFYADDLREAAVSRVQTKYFRRRGAAVALSEAELAFGGGIGLRQNCRYAGNHVRVTMDVDWPRGLAVKRHFGLGELFLPGKWHQFVFLPPAAHMSDITRFRLRDVPEPQSSPLMIGHWHRPPLALVFVRADGTRVEIGAGSDSWRWEQCLGCGAERGSYKVFLERDGIRVVREPLMCCQPFEPAQQRYRFSWYAAWTAGLVRGNPPDRSRAVPLDVTGGSRGMPVEADSGGKTFLLIDLARERWPAAGYRAASQPQLIRESRQAMPCWESAAVQKRLRRAVRRVAQTCSSGTFIFGPLLPGVCWDAGHLGRNVPDGLVHWDLPAMLDFSVWCRQTLGEDWTLAGDAVGIFQEFPSMRQLFSPNGFTV